MLAWVPDWRCEVSHSHSAGFAIQRVTLPTTIAATIETAANGRGRGRCRSAEVIGGSLPRKACVYKGNGMGSTAEHSKNHRIRRRMAAVEVSAGSQLGRLAGLLEAQVEEINDRHLARMRSELPELLRQPAVWEDVRDFSRESILAEVRALRGGATLPDACPSVDAEAARETALVGGSIDPMLSGYRSGHLAQWEAWFALVEDNIADAAERRELLERGSRFFFDYADRLSRFVTQIYTDERERMLRSREQRRVQLVRDVLDGANVDTGELGYDLDANHLGALAWGPQAPQALRALAERLGSSPLLIGVRGGMFWGWLGSAASSDRTELLRRFAPP